MSSERSAKNNCARARGRAEELRLKQGNRALRRRSTKSRARGPRAKPVWAHDSRRSACSGIEAPNHEGKPRRALARKTCIKLSGDNCGRRAKLAEMKQGNHTLSRRSTKAGPWGPTPSLSGHTTRGEKREQWHGGPAPRKQASKSARKKDTQQCLVTATEVRLSEPK